MILYALGRRDREGNRDEEGTGPGMMYARAIADKLAAAGIGSVRRPREHHKFEISSSDQTRTDQTRPSFRSEHNDSLLPTHTRKFHAHARARAHAHAQKCRDCWTKEEYDEYHQAKKQSIVVNEVCSHLALGAVFCSSHTRPPPTHTQVLECKVVVLLVTGAMYQDRDVLEELATAIKAKKVSLPY